MKIALSFSYLVGFGACSTTRVDPDTLPSIEVLLVPPRHPFPQVQEELRQLRIKRERSEKGLDGRIKLAYSKSRAAMLKEIAAVIQPFLQKRASLLETGHNVENVAINVLPVPDIGPHVKSLLGEIDNKRGIEETKQIEQGIKELDAVRSLIKKTVEESMRLTFGKSVSGSQTKPSKSSFIEEDKFGIKPVLNLRVGSSSIGDELKDGSSYPSVLGLVANENEDRNAAEMTLLNSLLYFTHQLGYDCINFVRAALLPGKYSAQPSSFIDPMGGPASDPSLVMTNVVKQMMRFIPPGVPRVWRKRAMKHSTVQLDIHPPESDSRLDAEMIRAMLKSERDLRKTRLKAYIKTKKRILKDIVFEIRTAISELAKSMRTLPKTAQARKVF
jgi:hypothetical protein